MHEVIGDMKKNKRMGWNKILFLDLMISKAFEEVKFEEIKVRGNGLCAYPSRKSRLRTASARSRR